MRLLALAPLFALAAAKLDLDIDLDLGLDLPTSSPFCPSGASTSTLWLADNSAYACAPLPGGGGSYASSGSTCITASAAALQGGRDLCEGAGDCVGGLCIELGGGMRRVCWTVASEGECAQFGKSE